MRRKDLIPITNKLARRAYEYERLIVIIQTCIKNKSLKSEKLVQKIKEVIIEIDSENNLIPNDNEN